MSLLLFPTLSVHILRCWIKARSAQMPKQTNPLICCPINSTRRLLHLILFVISKRTVIVYQCILNLPSDLSPIIHFPTPFAPCCIAMIILYIALAILSMIIYRIRDMFVTLHNYYNNILWFLHKMKKPPRRAAERSEKYEIKSRLFSRYAYCYRK